MDWNKLDETKQNLESLARLTPEGSVPFLALEVIEELEDALEKAKHEIHVLETPVEENLCGH